VLDRDRGGVNQQQLVTSELENTVIAGEGEPRTRTVDVSDRGERATIAVPPPSPPSGKQS
jgi:hypothetical protein